LCAQAEYRVVGGGGLMLIWLLFLSLNQSPAQEAPPVDISEQIHSTLATISETERKQREDLSTLFVINQRIKQIAKKRADLNDKMLERESRVRIAAQELQELEDRSDRHKGMLSKRLRQLYQERNRDTFQWLFSAKSPVELERNHRFLKRMIDSDHKHLKQYLLQVRELRQKRNQLKTLVAGLARMQKDVQAQENELAREMRQKSTHVAELKKIKASKLSELRGLRGKPGESPEALSFAFFERKGTLKPPVEAKLVRDYGTYVDAQFRFRLMHKGLFYAARAGAPVTAVFEGMVALARKLPGYGKTVIIDHGDNYYSVYAFASQLKVKEGTKVREGDVVAVSGGSSPLFGPGLYFEIRHFTDAIDPRSWIKDSVFKTVHLRSTSWDDVSGSAGH